LDEHAEEFRKIEKSDPKSEKIKMRKYDKVILSLTQMAEKDQPISQIFSVFSFFNSSTINRFEFIH